MNTEACEILTFLKAWPKEFFSPKEVGRRVGGKKKYREKPTWAKPYLTDLLNKELIEMNELGHYRYIPEDKLNGKKRFIAPHIRKLLKKSGKTFGEGVQLDEVDDFLTR